MKSYIETWEKIFGMKRVKRIFVAATRQNVGKTTVSLGLVAALKNHSKKVGFLKPIGQRYMLEGGYKVDEDSVLMERIFNFGTPIQHMSPIAVEKGYTESFLDNCGVNNMPVAIKEAFDFIAGQSDAVIIEGTGHAGVGSVFDLSNAEVARMLDSRVILVSPGGIGNAIDEIMLNKSVFDNKGVRLAGVIVNKVLSHKYDKINQYVRKGLARLDIPVLGVIPYIEMLDRPTLRDFKEELNMQVLCGEEKLDRQTQRILVGAMGTRGASEHFEDDCLIITPGNRTDIINLIIKVHTGRFTAPKRIAGLILSTGITPKRGIYNALRRAGIPTLLSKMNTYDVASCVHDLNVKIKARDKNKIKTVMDIIERYVDMEEVLKSLV